MFWGGTEGCIFGYFVCIVKVSSNAMDDPQNFLEMLALQYDSSMKHELIFRLH
jgi:hypothetical protein